MALPASGAISLASIQNEFGGTTPISIDEYYRGGANVGAVSSTVGIPASGAISFDDFHGKAAAAGGSGFSIVVTPGTIYKDGTGTITTASVTAVPSGQTGSVTYAWTKVSGDTMTVTSPTSSSTTFSTAPGFGNTKSAIYKCTATDSASHVASDTVDVTIAFDNGV